LWERDGGLAPVKNCDLWQRLDRALEYHDLQCRWLRTDNEHSAVGPLPMSSAASPMRIDQRAGWLSWICSWLSECWARWLGCTLAPGSTGNGRVGQIGRGKTRRILFSAPGFGIGRASRVRGLGC
ncbi:MAG TPA: hypothetical protein VIY86_06280, partial [Pirellulaceae bacterium]